jgi:hypothetical protein
MAGPTPAADARGGYEALPACVAANCRFFSVAGLGAAAAGAGFTAGIADGGVRAAKLRGAAASRGNSEPQPRQNL